MPVKPCSSAMRIWRNRGITFAYNFIIDGNNFYYGCGTFYSRFFSTPMLMENTWKQFSTNLGGLTIPSYAIDKTPHNLESSLVFSTVSHGSVLRYFKSVQLDMD
ncbi:unnamed protein product [Lepeophtheirus salmonis]|uniref:(salmon louse) hypothetical protein n=1 Tax=Lepeophtheirus salmonis TaxID=72036 RepID=A0A7R8CRS4_LEPSM|nr:unnamed protein product [Lepeophtheirus salmonis]CAF2906174.1 unnamed protein product [Lepeophtheirus salmonis]